ncbi:error-prone DNA polymerase, DnaE-like [Nakamurella panacisegetis]|uniref:Error-prone DNA polymerase n=1 Tax=Nakamurella panacisegetis TaxID=1090615 RepID=A0A1H0R579_9ACTN|nr:error-prone DNA polymerase [Nakamurella panacisegetis]SDP24590.1 error-prone DNA polymerase, DnaE-like [Nakamurella panacisegetis]
MGWSNPPVPWRELERALSGLPPLKGRGPPATVSRIPGTADQPPIRQPVPAPTPRDPAVVIPYAELHAHSAFSFLDGASTPETLAREAARLGLDALALTDHDGFYGVVRFAEAAKEVGLRTLYGAELSLDLPTGQLGVPDPVGRHLLVLARGQEGYRRLAQQISRAQLRGGEKGRPVYDLDELAAAADGHWLILTGCRKGSVRRALALGGAPLARAEIRRLIDRFGADNVVVELTDHQQPTDDEDNDELAGLAADLGLEVVATTGAHYARPQGSRLSSAVAAVRARRSLDEADPFLPAGPAAHLRSGAEMAALFARYPTAVANAARIGRECAFDLMLVAPQLPPFDVPAGHDENSHLRELTMAGAARRYGSAEQRPDAYAQIEKELGIISNLNFPGYFLIVHDIVDFCRKEQILCQGRGSAANSAVCYALGITAVDAVKYGLLFERFLAPERDGPPDIDVDIESDRREEVIQHVYLKYGREKAAQVANVNTFRPRMAVRDMAKAMGHSPGQQDAYSKQLDGWTPLAKQTADEHTIPADVLALAAQIQDYPRHLGIHSGGMVICDRPVGEVCPVEWGRMPNRSVLQWDKDDCAAIGLVKFDLLGLGMLSALHYAVDLVRRHEHIEVDFAQLDLEEPAVYEMLRRADSVGVFQVESRAQMATLPRLKPRTFYDLVVEVALIRPGPIQGGSVHPYIRRRNGLEPVVYDHPVMERSLSKTLGIPLFQEQLMQLAVDVAGFDAGEADQLRRAMGAKRSTAKMEQMKARLYDGMSNLHGITGDAADRIYERLLAFANFGFAESHALSFASLVFYSSWLKLHHPAAFTAALLRAQPMGFYSPQSLVADARRHGVTIRRPDINASRAEADLEPGPGGRPAIRLGLAGVRTVGTDLADRIVAARPEGGYRDIDELTRAITLTSAEAEALATSGALDALTLHGESPLGHDRRRALWAAGAASGERAGTLPGAMVGLDAPSLPGMSEIELTVADIWATGISPEMYPTEFSREALDRLGVVRASDLGAMEHGTRVLVAGMVTHRQRPATASGIIFVNLEDESGMINVVCSTGFWSKYRKVARGSPSLLVRGMLERQGAAFSVLAERIAPLALVATTPSRDFR